MLTPGLRGTARVAVGPEHTAQALGSGDLPVFGTPALIALLERAAVAAVIDHLAPGDTTVGTRIEVAHLAATPVGDEVRAEAEVTMVAGRKLAFSVAAFDGRQKVGEGRHERVLVTRERFMARLSRP
jgi:predicted thioesterase